MTPFNKLHYKDLQLTQNSKLNAFIYLFIYLQKPGSLPDFTDSNNLKDRKNVLLLLNLLCMCVCAWYIP